jgi:hypothetical protein
LTSRPPVGVTCRRLDETTAAHPIPKESKADRRLRKDAERLDDARLLEGWERYRALGDLLDHLTDIVEMADRRTRFALLILAAMNAINLLIAVRADQLDLRGLSPLLVRGYVAAYIFLSLYFFAYAIVALKPRLRQRHRHGGAAPGRLRMVDDILDRDADAYYAEWQQAQIGELNREMAHHVHALARTSAEKYHALDRVYLGLVVLLALMATLIAVVAVHLLTAPPT